MSTSTTPASLTRRPRLHGRVAFVTGGTRGIGAAICHSLAEQGADVAAGYSRDRDAAESFIGKLTGEGLKGSIHQGNIGSADDCRRTVSEVIEEHGRLDILVNNAGITIDKTVLKMTDEDWFKVISVNLSGAFFMSQAVLPHMIERGSGRIVNISSIIGETGNIGQANYAASKSGLFGLTKTLALEAARELKKAGKLEEDSPGVTVAASDHHAVARLEITNGPIKGRRGETQQARAGGGGRLPDLNPADHYSSTAPGRTLIGRKRSVAFDQSDASRRKAKFLGDDLPDGGARSGSKVDLPGEHSDPAVPCDAEITVDAVGCDCVDACLGAARQGERDDDSRGAAEERAARDRGHGSALPRRAKNSGNHPRMTAAPAKILGERLPDVGFSRTRAAR